MRQVCNTLARSLSILTLVALAAGLTAAQQSRSRDLRLVSARAGGINYVAGEARARAATQTEWRALDTTHDLSGGDTVRTGVAGRLEVLLNPGSYLRVGEQTEFEMADTSLEDLRLKLTRGSVVIEATGYDDMNPSISVVTPQVEVAIIRSGVYRLNVLPGGLTEVVVVKGRASVGEPPTIVKGGNVARIGGAGLEVVKYDKKRRDELDQWSKERAGDLADANRAITNRSMRTLLASTHWDSFFPMEGGSGYGPAGVWVFNPGTGCYTFLPRFSGWRSPYGSYYDSQFYVPYGRYCSTCGNGRQQPVGSNPGRTFPQPNNNPPRNAPPDGGGFRQPPSRESRPLAVPSRDYSRPAPAPRPAPAAVPARRDQ